MNEVKNLEQLQAEKARLQLKIKSIEADVRSEIDYLNNHMQPIFTAVEYARKLVKPVSSNVAQILLPFIIDKFTRNKSTKTKLWGVAATLAGEYLMKKVDISSIMQKVTGLFTNRQQPDEEYDDNENEENLSGLS